MNLTLREEHLRKTILHFLLLILTLSRLLMLKMNTSEQMRAYINTRL